MRIVSLMPRSGIWLPRLDALAARHPEHEFILDPELATSSLKDADALITQGLPDPAFLAEARLKALFTPLAGVNHLPMDALAAKGVRVFNSHGNAEFVAERTLAMILAFLGRLIPYHEDLRQGIWHGPWVGKGAEDQWDSLFGRRVCVFGAGAIGSALAGLLKAFRCELTAFRKHPEAGPPEGFDFVEADFEAAVAGSEILVIALPLTSETRGLFSKEVLLRAQGKFLVNIGRGEVLDEEGLYLALKQGILKGAAIDTWFSYPQAGATKGEPSRYPISSLDNVVLSPHVAGAAREAAKRMVEDIISSLEEWLARGSAPNEVDTSLRY